MQSTLKKREEVRRPEKWSFANVRNVRPSYGD